jgi:glycerol-3-phosphate dehydrogenase
MSKIIRDPEGFAEETYDLIIIGGGIYGVMLSFEASKRGLKSLLLEKADFGGATTYNCLRILHGGFRYLQSLDLHRIRESVAERSWFLKTFPDLVVPLPCLMPLYGKGLHRPSILRLALRVNDFLSRHRNNGVSAKCLLPDGRIISADETNDICHLIDLKDLKGGAVWYDAHMQDSERIVIELLEWSCENGASALNNVEAEELLLDGKKVSGVCARDLESDTIHEFKSGVVINAAGPWCRELAAQFDRDIPELFISSIAWNVLFNRPAISSHVVAVAPQKPNAQTYFLVPWKDKLLAGTGHAPWNAGSENPIPNDTMLNSFIEVLNLAVPSLNVSSNDIEHVFSGLLPVKKSGSVDLTKREKILHHADHNGPQGLYSISGIKFTTSRLVAEKTIKRIYPEQNILDKHSNKILKL